MGRGRGGYTEIQKDGYVDSGGNPVTDKGSIFVAERYIEAGYESVFRQTHDEIPGQKAYDLTIKDSSDIEFIKNIEVKRTTSSKPSQMAKNIKEGFEQVGEEGTVAVYLPNRVHDADTMNYINEAFAEAQRKGWIKGKVEVWLSDSKTMNDKIDLN